MSPPSEDPAKPTPTAFEKAAGETRDRSVWTEFWGFLRENRKWWMIPLAVALLALGLLVLLSGTGFAPFIYTLF